MSIKMSFSNNLLSQKIIPSLFSAIPRVTKKLELKKLVFHKVDLEELFSACNAKKLELFNCIMNVSSAPDLSSIHESNIINTNSHIKRLVLSGIEGNDNFYKLLGEGISKSQRLINSLEYVRICENEVKKKDVEDMKDLFEQAGMYKPQLETDFYQWSVEGI